MQIGLIILIATTVVLLILGLGCICLPCCTDIKCNNCFFLIAVVVWFELRVLGEQLSKT